MTDFTKSDFTKFIPRGRSNAIPAEKLAKLAGFRNSRELRECISARRRSGELICSSTGRHSGYYFPESREELQSFIRQMQASAKSLFLSIQAARRALQQMPGQEELELNPTTKGI